MLLGGAEAAVAQDVDELFSQLSQAEPGSAPYLAGKIRQEWAKSGSAAVDLLLGRGDTALRTGRAGDAIGHFTAAIDHAPDFTQAYQQRAVAYMQAGYLGAAVADLRTVLAAEPRHFDALQVFAMIQEQLNRPEAALRLWDEVERLLPGDAAATQARERLVVQLDGTEL